MTAHDRCPVIAISQGDPAGIGPEVLVTALADPELREAANWLIIGNASVLSGLAEQSRLPIDTVMENAEERPSARVTIVDNAIATQQDIDLRRPNAACGRESLEHIRVATELCLANVSDAMVTGPVSKEAVSLAGKQFTGHTEYIAELCNVTESRMLLANDRLRVVHVTTHCSLEDATKSTRQRVLDTIELGHAAMMRLGWPEPRIGVCGMNPHAGENGLFGHQEQRVIEPAIKDAQARGIGCEGPYPADTLFLQAYRGRYDLVVAMYHDQGHVPMKLLDFEHTVNVSLGLPIVRTSVDHGTAYDIAGQGLADATDMKSAMRFAARMVDSIQKGSQPASH